jgi:hypothetical protein
MSYADFMRRKKINSPQIIDTQMKNPDVSSVIWRTKLATSIQSGLGDHIITNNSDPSNTGTSLYNKKVAIYKSSGYGGRNQDVSNYVLYSSAKSIAKDVFSGKIVTKDDTCLTRTPASQIVSEKGNSDLSLNGLNMGYVSDCTPFFKPQVQTQFVDYLPSIKRGLGGQSREDWNGEKINTHFGSQKPFVCPTVFIQGNAKVSNAADGLVPKDIIKIEKPDRPYNLEFAKLQTARTGEQVGGGNIPGSRAPKVGGALRKIPSGINHRGVASLTKGRSSPYKLNNGLRSVPAINNPPGNAVKSV